MKKHKDEFILWLDLLMAAKDILNRLDDIVVNDDRKVALYSGYIKAMDILRAAIAKAEGE